MRTIALVMLLLTACTDGRPIAIQTAELPQENPVDERDQYALLTDIEAARGHGLVGDPGALERVRADWQGKRVRWDVALSRALCRDNGTDPCVVLPFDHARRPEPIVQGWLPRLLGNRDELHTRCATKALCVLTIEATLTRFTMSNEEPTSLTFDDVRVLDAREARTEEAWIRRADRPALAAAQRQ